jgi:hypothetical protein
VAFFDIRDAAADRRRDLSVGTPRFLLQLYDVAIDVIGRYRAASGKPARDYHRSNCRRDTQLAKCDHKTVPSEVENQPIPDWQASERYY